MIFFYYRENYHPFHIKAHQSRRKFAPKCTNKAKNLHQQGKNCTKGNHYNKASNKNGVGLHIFRALLTPTGENKGGYWLRQDLRATLPVNGAQSALWAEINRQLTKIRVWRILRAVRFEQFDQSTTSNNVTDWLIFLLMLAWTVTFADVGARNRQARVQNYGHCCAYNFRTFQCKYWLVTSMQIEPVVIIIIRIEYSIQKMFKIHLPKATNMI